MNLGDNRAMLWNSLMKKPMLILGILMFGIFLYDYNLRKQGKGGIFERKSFKTWSCRPIEIKIEQLGLPSGWEMECNKSNMKFTIHLKEEVTPNTVKSYMYRELANSLVWIAKKSPSDSLERVLVIHTEIHTPLLRINAITEGKDLQLFKKANSQDQIKSLLRSTVQVKETTK